MDMPAIYDNMIFFLYLVHFRALDETRGMCLWLLRFNTFLEIRGEMLYRFLLALQMGLSIFTNISILGFNILTICVYLKMHFKLPGHKTICRNLAGVLIDP